MKKFKYRLEALLKMKEHIEKERQKDHATALLKVKTQEENNGSLNDKKENTIIDQAKVMQGSLSVAELLVYGRYIMRLKRERLAGEEMLKVLNQAEKEKREKLVDATKEKRIQEKLKEKHRGKFDDEIKLLEGKENDEIAGNSFRLKQNNLL